MDNSDLYEYAEAANIEVEKVSLQKNKSLSVQIGTSEYIGIDKVLTDNSAEERVCLAHEIGHCVTGSFYNIYSPLDIRSKHERRADKWAILHCVPKDKLTALLKKRYTRPEIAEYFGVTEKMIITAYTYYFEYGIAG